MAQDQNYKGQHLEVKGIRDGKAHCKCGWVSAFGGSFSEHTKVSSQDDIVWELRKIRAGFEWFGAQGNIPMPDSSWSGVQACMRQVDARIAELTSTDTPSTGLGIHDTSNGQCDSVIMVEGVAYQCSLASDHNGWSHSNSEVVALWK